MSAPLALISNLDPTTQQVMQLANLYGLSAESNITQPFNQIPYATLKRSSIPIPTGAMLEGCVAHFHLDVTLGLDGQAAPALSFLDVLAAVNEIFMTYNGSQSSIWSSDSIFAAQRMAMEFPQSDYKSAYVVPVPNGAGTAYSYDWYADIPAVYSLATEMGILNENSDSVHSSIGVVWGDVQYMFQLLTGQTASATGYVEFIANRVDAPQNPATDGLPDLTKNYIVSYQDIALTGKNSNTLPLDLSDTVTRLTLNFFEGGVGDGGVEAYDSTNALQVNNVKLGWGTNVWKFDAPYWWYQQQAAKWYGEAFQDWINRGTVVIDLDKTGGRDWIDAESVTGLQAIVSLGATPPAGSFCRVTIEQLVNTGTVPLR